MRFCLSTLCMLGITLVMLSACDNTSYGVDNSSELPMQDAHFVEADEQNVKAVQKALAPFFNGAKIQLAGDVFTRSSTLVIDKQAPLDRQGNIINGRDMSRPGDGNSSAERFYLKTENDNCYLLHQASDKRVLLADLKCLPAPAQG